MPSPPFIATGARIQLVLGLRWSQNAFDADTDAETPMVRITVTSDRYGVETSIFDSGPGVAAELDAKLFKPFFTTKARGTGLGLASCRAIVEAHDGSIAFENLRPGGCRFWFRLPASSA